jgi:hypothetical protein
MTQQTWLLVKQRCDVTGLSNVTEHSFRVRLGNAVPVGVTLRFTG